MRTLSIVCALVLTTLSAARAQDVTKVDPGHYKVVIENQRTRILRAVVGPGEQVPMHDHPDAIMIPLSPLPNSRGAQPPGALFAPAVTHGGANSEATTVDFVYVELKSGAAPDAPSKQPGPGATLLVTHPKADVVRVTAGPGFNEPAGTMHDYDKVIVALGDSELSLTVDGRTTKKWKRGDVAFIGRNVPHETKFAGQPADFVIVAIK
jgi:quercetin dioxygenase-like cupin family protein